MKYLSKSIWAKRKENTSVGEKRTRCISALVGHSGRPAHDEPADARRRGPLRGPGEVRARRAEEDLPLRAPLRLLRPRAEQRGVRSCAAFFKVAFWQFLVKRQT